MRKLAFIILLAAAVLLVMLSGCTELEAECGDNVCNRLMESPITCAKDCAEGYVEPDTTEPYCGDGAIDKGENCGTCPEDAGCTGNNKCLGNKCVSNEACKGNGDCIIGKKCVKGLCELKTCSERKGSICAKQQSCEGRMLAAADTTECCSQPCTLKECGELHGKICEEGTACSRHYLSASDSDECCPFEALCIEGATCNYDGGCRANCERGDSDCDCVPQLTLDNNFGGPMPDANTCVYTDYVYSTEATGCCADLVEEWVCLNSDGLDYFRKGTCRDYWLKRSGGIEKERNFTDHCTMEDGKPMIVEYTCMPGFYGERKYSCAEIITPISDIPDCDTCINGACPKPAEEE
ncbi:hypothetical protein KJ891_00255 [Candidatus Micrarchaeota archaeon]|nr:hypothetical protein [Candidatus Micrarchaeota archaeon]